MKRALSTFLALLTLAACYPQGAAPIPPPALPTNTPETSSPASAAPTPTPANLFEVDAWVNRPAPSREDRVIVYGSLIYRGVRLGGLMMRANWPQESYEAGTHDCFVLVTYGRGVCVLEAADFPAGVSIPITVTFDYKGQTYTGQTQFTPR